MSDFDCLRSLLASQTLRVRKLTPSLRDPHFLPAIDRED